MARIANLPALGPAQLDGTEDVPVVKGGATFRAQIDHLAGIAATAAQIAQQAAENARDIAAGERNYFATIAEGVAATVAPATFSSDEDGTLRWYSAAGNPIGTPLQSGLLASVAGAALVGTSRGVTVERELTGFATRAEMKALALADGDRVYFTDPTAGGDFVFRAGNYAGKIAADPLEGFYIAIDSVAPDQGALVRVAQFAFPEFWGAVGDGIADDTAPIQAAFNHGLPVRFGHAVYGFTNLTKPNRANFSVHAYGVEFKRLAGGDAEYGIACEKWVTNNPTAQQPMEWRGGKINGQNNCKHPFVHQAWNSDLDLETCYGNGAGLKVTANTKDGTAFPGSTLVNNRIKLRSHHNLGCGLWVRDSGRNKANDGMLLPGSFLYSNGDCGAYIESGAGWQCFADTYDNAVGGIVFDAAGKGTIVSASYIDDGELATVPAGLESGQTKTYAIFAKNMISGGQLLVSGNWISGPVSTTGNGDTPPYGIKSIGNEYYTENGCLIQNFFGPTRCHYSENDSFESTDPFRFANGSSTGRFKVVNATLHAKGFTMSGSFNALQDGTLEHFADGAAGQAFANPRKIAIGTVNAGAAFAFAFPLPKMGSFQTRFVDILLSCRDNWVGNALVAYRATYAVHTKTIGVDAPVFTKVDEKITAGEWTVAPSIALAHDNAGNVTLTWSGDPASAQAYGLAMANIV